MTEFFAVDCRVARAAQRSLVDRADLVHSGFRRLDRSLAHARLPHPGQHLHAPAVAYGLLEAVLVLHRDGGLVIWISAAMWLETFRETDDSFEWGSFPGFFALVLGGFYPAFIFLRYLFVGVAIFGTWTLTGVLTLALCAAVVAVFVMIVNWANPR